MKELLDGLMEKVGLDESKANSVIAFLKENASKVPGWLGGAAAGIGGKVAGGLGGLGLGGDDD